MDLSVMISHASMDAQIGTAWQRLVKRVLPESKLRYSSDPRDPAFSGYGAFASEILGWIEQSRYILTVQTLTSISSAHSCKKILPILVRNASTEPPFRNSLPKLFDS